ncbi:MAG: hypothetical protein V4645_31940 [Pseudomonadota bacterium]
MLPERLSAVCIPCDDVRETLLRLDAGQIERRRSEEVIQGDECQGAIGFAVVGRWIGNGIPKKTTFGRGRFCFPWLKEQGAVAPEFTSGKAVRVC